MGKAAQRLNISQPAVSRSIAELEHALGVRLLGRQNQGVEPTEYGRALLECGVAAFDELRQGVKNIEFLADPATGETRVGGNPFLATTFACMTIDRLFRCYPRTVIHLTAGPEQDLYRKLRDRSLDLVITRRFGPIDERFEFEFLLDDSPFLVVAGVRSPWAQRRKIELAELVNESWLLPPQDSGMESLVTEAFRASRLAYPRTAREVLSLPNGM